MSAIQGLLKYRSEWKDSRDFQNCPSYRGCPLLRVSVKRGSTVHACLVKIHIRCYKSCTTPDCVVKLNICILNH